LPTMGCWVQMLRPGEHTKMHRHNSNALYYAFNGSGTTFVNDQRFAWEQGDCFVVPSWSWHSHENRSRKEEAILFSLNDTPLMKTLKLYREQAQEDN